MNFIPEALMQYCESMSEPENEVLNRITRHTNLTHLNPRMLSGHLQGQFLKMITAMIQPKCILEIGTFTGYSAVCMAMGMPENSRLHTIESDDELEATILNNFELAGCSSKITLHIGDAIQLLPNLLETHPFDMVFIDADKGNYPNYYQMIKSHLKSGSYLLADNVLWSGKILDSAELKNDFDTRQIHLFNSTLASDPDFETMILPLRDGITIARKR
jgi:predicted O-methyltransferase YrrM